ncbi:PAS fold-containing protein [Halogranum gelatinilyticum]|uniref:histidine kinase n=1 Tax=Halogranum gelatinilyticum TaxID=660521 RepID=A0A1G9UEU4_9EURY|nr:PAS domain-containing sensor histidine kinase [Halogranum gelatinilyticum]SDM58477.1 PAS fold-containing protein [Halogranum gelatinilyticum]
MSILETANRSVLVVGESTEPAVSALTDALDGIEVEEAADVTTACSIETVDCVVVAPGETPVSTVVEAVREVDTDVPIVVFRPTTAVTPGAALDAGATDVVPADVADATRLLVARVEAAVENRRREREHVETTNLLDALFERIPLHLYVKDTEGRHLRVSSAYTDDPEQFVGKTDVELYDNANSGNAHADDMRVITENEPILHKREPLIHDDEGRFDATGLRDHYSDDPFGDETLLDSDLLDDADTLEDGHEGWVLTSKVPWYDADGTVAGLIGVTVDVSQQEAYRRLLERQNERLSEFASVVTHDLRNPLNTAQGYLELARETGDDEYFDRVADAHKRMEELIADVLTLARTGTDVADCTDVDLASVVADAWEICCEPGATLDVASPLGTARADESRLRELLENLFRNSVEHGSTSSRPQAEDSVERGSTRTRAWPDDSTKHGTATADNEPETDVRITVGLLDDDAGFYVEDDGPGIPEGEHSRVFEPGVTSRKEGTGFGLPIVRRIAEAHGWAVDVTDAEHAETGARFEFRYDAAPDTVTPRPE